MNEFAGNLGVLVIGAILIIMALVMTYNKRDQKMTQSDKHGLPLATFNQVGREPGETILRLTDEQRPRFEAAARAGKPLPADIAESFMAQLFPDDQPSYEPDDGPLTEAGVKAKLKCPLSG